MSTIGDRNTAKTHCKRGHEYTPENTYVSKSRALPFRQCRECRRLKNREGVLPKGDPLNSAALRRLREAIADGVSLTDLEERFGYDRNRLKQLAAEAT
jgi:hypothetical protein